MCQCQECQKDTQDRHYFNNQYLCEPCFSEAEAEAERAEENQCPYAAGES